MLRRQTTSSLFPYTTLFRSITSEDKLDQNELDQLASQMFGVKIPALNKLQASGFIDEHLADRKSTRLNSSHRCISYAVFCLKKKMRNPTNPNSTKKAPIIKW